MLEETALRILLLAPSYWKSLAGLCLSRAFGWLPNVVSAIPNSERCASVQFPLYLLSQLRE